nr:MULTISPECIES: diguanylate cyclase [unclassified Leptolyngbya]
MLVNGARQERDGHFVNDCILIPIRQRIQYEDEILKAKRAAEAATRAQQQAEVALRQQYERTLLLKQITQDIRLSLDSRQIFKTAATQIGLLFNVDRCLIYAFTDVPLPRLSLVAEYLSPDQISLMQGPFPILTNAHTETMMAQDEVVVSPDVFADPLLQSAAPVCQQIGLKSMLAVRTSYQGRPNGAIQLHQCDRSRSWENWEIDFLQRLSNQLSIAIQQSNLYSQLALELRERKQAEARLQEMNHQLNHAKGLLEKLVNLDGLTQIANRRCFDEHLRHEWQRLQREEQPLSLLLFDIDHFKLYNDSYGHQEGDRCLIAVAQAAQQVVKRPADLVARYGGEEFVVLLPNTSRSGAIAVAERIHKAIRALHIPHNASPVSNVVTISLGMASIVPAPETSPDILLNQADRLLYCAKQRGRNQSAIFPMEYALSQSSS